MDGIMSEMVGCYIMLFSLLHFMNSRCWRPFYDLSDPPIRLSSADGDPLSLCAIDRSATAGEAQGAEGGFSGSYNTRHINDPIASAAQPQTAICPTITEIIHCD
jgi:hypothetical protein